MRSFAVEVDVFEDGMLGVKAKVDLAPGRYPGMLVIGPKPIASPHGSPPLPQTWDQLPLAEFVEKARREHIRRVLERCGGNRTQAARELGVDPRTVFRFLAEDDE